MKNLTQGNIYKTFILFAIPMVLAGILSQCYNIIDTVIAGRYLGDSGLAQLGASSAFIAFISSIFWGYYVGCSIYAAKLFGAGEYEELKNVIYNNIFVVFIVSTVLSAVIVVCHSQVIDFLKAEDSIRGGADAYMSIYIAGIFLVTMNAFFSYILNALGSSSFPLVISFISAILNIGGNILSVAVLDIGVAGVAASTVLSALIADICYYIKLRQCFRQLGILKHRVKISLKPVKDSCAYALPTLFQQMMMYAVSMLISPMINVLGSAATASYTVISKIYDINANIYQNSAKTLSNYTAQCVGAGKQKNLRRGVKVGLLQGIMFLAPVLILCVTCSERVCRLFFPENVGGEAIDYSVMFIRFYLPFILFNLINNLFHAFFRGTGSMRLLVTCTATGAVSRLLFTLILAGKYAMRGVFIGWVLSWITEAVLAVSVYFSGKWEKDCNIKTTESK